MYVASALSANIEALAWSAILEHYAQTVRILNRIFFKMPCRHCPSTCLEGLKKPTDKVLAKSFDLAADQLVIIIFRTGGTGSPHANCEGHNPFLGNLGPGSNNSFHSVATRPCSFLLVGVSYYSIELRLRLRLRHLLSMTWRAQDLCRLPRR
ncbi:hypothetical protein VTN02DRAFT_4492 [Thermoascus thermophilus]